MERTLKLQKGHVAFVLPSPTKEEAERWAEIERQERMRRIMEKETKA